MVAFEDILKDIGQFGTYQRRIYVLLCYPALFLSGLMVVNVFLLAIPEHRLVDKMGYSDETDQLRKRSHFFYTLRVFVC